ncbi:RICIN domain-containing protein [Streptomyces sp. NPDC001137]|uniref:RICIN domain-containing protein n=1 Tax=Streptomyces sp. NPDC001137 TaxID=3154378 RepID=UPI003316B049
MDLPRQGQSHEPHAGESSTMGAVRLRRVNRWLAQDLGGELADLYVDSRETSVAEAYRSRSRQDFLNRLTGDIRRPGFAMVIAETDHLMGCVHGFPVASDGFWWRGFDGALPRSIEQLTVAIAFFGLDGSGGTGGTTTGPVHATGSGKCLDVPGLSQTNGTRTQIWDCNGGTNQQISPCRSAVAATRSLLRGPLGHRFTDGLPPSGGG